MNKGNFYAASVAVVVGLFLAGCSALRVPSGQAQGEPGVSIAKAAPASGPSEGIKVHGHWVIEVRNPDGTLASRREFENVLLPEGSFSLAQFLSRKKSPGFWRVSLNAVPPGPLCGAIATCVIGESADPLPADAAFFKTLTVALVGSKVELKGSATVPDNGAIGRVNTFVADCPANTAPATPCGSSFSGMTGTNLASPQSVVAGQQVQVTVTLSFS